MMRLALATISSTCKSFQSQRSTCNWRALPSYNRGYQTFSGNDFGGLVVGLVPSPYLWNTWLLLVLRGPSAVRAGLLVARFGPLMSGVVAAGSSCSRLRSFAPHGNVVLIHQALSLGGYQDGAKPV
jgi:hypothetical protein